MRVYTIGDIHGCFEPFCLLIEKLGINKGDKIVLLGDYIDRGPDSKKTIDKILQLIEEGYNLIPLMGNHEKMLLSAYDTPKNQVSWVESGGWSTLKSFNCESVTDIPSKYIEFLRGMHMYHRHNNFFFVHAGFNEEIEFPFSDNEAMLWARKEEYSSELFSKSSVIHAHTPIALELLKSHLKSRPKVINIDTGCIYKQKSGLGFLSALEVNTLTLFSVKNE